MRVVVIDPPKPVATPADIPGEHAGDDAMVVAMIAAATASIDGPSGWLGRAIGVQTLELRSDCWPASLPFRPVIDIVSATVDGELVDGVDVEPDGVLTLPPGVSRPLINLRICYRAGYGKMQGEGDAAELVNDPPAHAKAAIVLMTVELMSQARADGGLRSFQVDGAFTESYNSPEMVERTRTRAVENLLAPLRVFA